MILILTSAPRSASTWLEAVFLAVRERYALGWVPRGDAPYRADLQAGGLRDGHIYPGVFLRWDELGLGGQRHPCYVLHVRRDPRDLLVSLYFSMKRSHVPAGILPGWRQRLLALPEEDGLLAIVSAHETFMTAWIAILESYLGKGEADRCHAVEFVELVGHPYAHLRAYLEAAGLGVDPDWLRDTLDARSFSRLAGGRSPGEEDVNHHFRKGISGDWRNRFTPRIAERFKALHGEALVRLGYEKDLDW